MESKDRIIVALDVVSVMQAHDLVSVLRGRVGMFKVGLEFITALIANVFAAASEEDARFRFEETRRLFGLLDGKLFYDGKFDDIPNTVGKAAKVLGRLHPKMFNVHASATINSLAAAAANKGDSLLLAVTVLTSTDEVDCETVFGVSPSAKVLQFARDAVNAGCDGLVCSPQELELLGKHPELDKLLRVTPGIRAKDAKPDDQRRTMTAYEAALAGADYEVIGRPITAAPDPVAAAISFADEIAAGIAARGKQ